MRCGSSTDLIRDDTEIHGVQRRKGGLIDPLTSRTRPEEGEELRVTGKKKKHATTLSEATRLPWVLSVLFNKRYTSITKIRPLSRLQLGYIAVHEALYYEAIN